MPNMHQNGAPPRTPELMAPAGTLEAGYAALHFGADAVYLGLQKFSARADAENFTFDELDRLTAYAHALTPRRKVFVALNTLILQRELREVVELIAHVADIGVDALIVQDLGVFRIAQRYFPSLRLHASTQMAVHNLEGALTFQNLGFQRVTLARELTLDEIREISQNLSIETEFFAHGALCYSYSGLCLMSSLLTGRSGNRGRCAYLCRDRFRVLSNDTGSFLFSMKDLCTADHIAQLAQTGVASLKIEGRKKSPLYVAATVNYYRRLLDQRLSPAEKQMFESDIQTIFSRPWTSLHLDTPAFADVTDPTFVGHRGARIGRVDAIVTRDDAHWIRFTTERNLERFDGLQLELTGLDKPYGFSVEDMAVCRGSRTRPRKTFEAHTGTCVEVRLPPHHPPIPKGAILYCSSSQAVKRRYRYNQPKPDAFRVQRDVHVTLKLSRDGITVMASCGEVVAHLHSDVALKPARKLDPVACAVRDAFEKTGGTRFRVCSLTLDNPDGLFVPISSLNDLRRRVLNSLDKMLSEKQAQRIRTVVQCEAAPVSPRQLSAESPKWSLKIADPGCLDRLETTDRVQIEEVVLDLGYADVASLPATLTALAKRWGYERIRLALPLITRSWERDDLRKKMAVARDMDLNRWEAAHISAWTFLNRNPGTTAIAASGLDLSCDWSIYVLNPAAARQVLDLGASRFVLSPEDTWENMSTLLNEFADQAVVILYQDTPLFISENCIRPALAQQATCPTLAHCNPVPLHLRSSHDDRLSADTRPCRTVVISEHPLCWSPFLSDFRAAGATRFRIDLTWRPHSPEGVLRIWRAATAGQALPHTHIGNFQRGLL